MKEDVTFKTINVFLDCVNMPNIIITNNVINTNQDALLMEFTV